MDVSNLHRLLHSWPVDPISYDLDPETNGQWVGYEYRPRTCCSRAVITFTACCRIMSLVKGWLDPDWRDTISPSSLNASLMSRTRSLKIRKKALTISCSKLSYTSLACFNPLCQGHSEIDPLFLVNYTSPKPDIHVHSSSFLYFFKHLTQIFEIPCN